ncbi:MAG: four helix bundle protein [Candidatus Peribacteraceae bacterium]|nr:four helix bundle protein [Candidatus Peribacteraceae bacterium]MDD5742418.1 four helix bundle protein [Candidatus Peribacteraceae bacterium]
MNTMCQSPAKIQSFLDLRAWQEAHKLVLLVYTATKVFPKEEIFCLVSQLRRAVISITSNIAEGFSRQFPKEKIQFCYQALSSLTEVQNQIIASRDIGYLTDESYSKIFDQTTIVSKILNGLIKKVREDLN